jgi:hypothetical protein
MTQRSTIALLFLVAAAVSISPLDARAQRSRNRGKVHSLQATSDKAGVHPDTATDIPASSTIMCINGVSETPNVVVSCSITAPGFKGILKKGETAKTTAAGTVTMTCSGQGYMRCSARIDIPPA